MVVEVRVGEGRGAEGAGLVCWFMKYGGDWLRGRQVRVCLSLCFGVGGKKEKSHPNQSTQTSENTPQECTP